VNFVCEGHTLDTATVSSADAKSESAHEMERDENSRIV